MSLKLQNENLYVITAKESGCSPLLERSQNNNICDKKREQDFLFVPARGRAENNSILQFVEGMQRFLEKGSGGGARRCQVV